MAVKTVQYVFNGQTYDLTFDASTGEYKATVPAPQKSSYSQSGRREQHWQMVLTPYLLKHPTMMEMQQALRRFHSLLIQFHRHLLLQIQQMDLSQIRQLWLYLVRLTMLHLNLSQLQSMAHPLQLILMVHSARKLLLLVVPIQLLLLQRIRLARLQL